jgi:hypothetical protein
MYLTQDDQLIIIDRICDYGDNYIIKNQITIDTNANFPCPVRYTGGYSNDEFTNNQSVKVLISLSKYIGDRFFRP